jgi:epsilon-lactone hydrolase
LPPLLLQVGDTEILLDDAVRFVEKAQAAGVDATLEVYPDMPHVFQAFAPFLPDANLALERVGKFIKKQF